MRYIGPYEAASTPSYATLAAASTPQRRAALMALNPRVIVACEGHTAAMPNVHALAPADLTDAEKETLIDGYEGRSARVKRRLEAMRTSLGQAHLDLCPYCSLESTAQLDHFLPKRRYPEFSLYGPNLLPICPVCNQAKASAVADEAGRRSILMPSSDASLLQPLLVASLTIPPVPHVTFSINPAAQIAAADLGLVERHFGRLGLARRYRRRAHSLIAAIKANVQAAGGTRRIALRAIRDGYASAQIEGPPNSWRLALYKAIWRRRNAFATWLIN